MIENGRACFCALRVVLKRHHRGRCYHGACGIANDIAYMGAAQPLVPACLWEIPQVEFISIDKYLMSCTLAVSVRICFNFYFQQGSHQKTSTIRWAMPTILLLHARHTLNYPSGVAGQVITIQSHCFKLCLGRCATSRICGPPDIFGTNGLHNGILRLCGSTF